MKSKKNFWLNKINYLTLIPAFLMFLIFRVYPLCWSFVLSFLNFSFIEKSKFIGFQNFITFFSDKVFLSSLKITIIFTFSTVPLTIIGSLFLAMLIDHPKLRGRNFFKALIFMPYVTSGVVIAIIWKWFYGERFGLFNVILNIFNIKSINWLGSDNTALLSIIIVTVWANVGFFMLIFYGNLTIIDKKLYEAAEIDGANALQKFIYITLNQLKPAFSISIILAIIYFFRSFSLVYNMTAGGPGKATNVLSYQIYKTAFTNLDFGTSSVGVVFMFVIVCLFLIIQTLFSEKKENA